MFIISRLIAVVLGLSAFSNISMAQSDNYLVLKKDLVFSEAESRNSQSFYVLNKNEHCRMEVVGNNLRNSQYVSAQGIVVLPAGLKFKISNVMDNKKDLDLEDNNIYASSLIYSKLEGLDTSLTLLCVREFSLIKRVQKPKEILNLFSDVVDLQ